MEHITTDIAPDKESSVKLNAFCDANWGGETNVSAKSTSGNLIYFGSDLISWSSKLQSTIALSTAEAEHISAFTTAQTVIYFRQFLERKNSSCAKTQQL